VSPAGQPVPFEKAAKAALNDSQLRRNLAQATGTIRAKRESVVNEMPDWQALKDAGAAVKERTLRHLDTYLLQLEESVERAGGQVHWARDGVEANGIITGIIAGHDATEVVKVKSLTTDEIELNSPLAGAGVTAVETDLAELIIQLAGEKSSHILVPAIHKNRAEIRDVFLRSGVAESDLSDDPGALAEAARLFLRRRFLRAPIGLSGANFAVAETGTVCVVESEGNGRMCTTLPPVLISVMGIEKVIPTWRDLEVFLQLLPRSSTGERMNPYTSLWSGVSNGDGPREFHLVLLDNGRTRVLADEIGRQTLKCIRCSACLNICPVYSRTGGHAYGSVYPGPIGAILTPQLVGVEHASSLPFASTLCGACYDVCPVEINIPEVLVYLRSRVVQDSRGRNGMRAKLEPERVAMRIAARVFASRKRYEKAQKLVQRGQWPLARDAQISWLPGKLGGWTATRDLRAVPSQTFREWWRTR
jgi:L-lactate dehydrogenase complex protein LldF